jgi:hypothetical protein
MLILFLYPFTFRLFFELGGSGQIDSVLCMHGLLFLFSAVQEIFIKW